MSWEMTQWLEEIVREEGEDGFLMTPDTRRFYNSRRLASRHVHLRSRPSKNHFFNLPVVSGPSGSGKTWFMINSKHSKEIGLYFSASELQFPENLKSICRDSYTETLKIFAAAVCKLVPTMVQLLLKQCDPKECGLFVVVDDMGASPHLLRALCQCALGLEESVQKALGVSLPCDFMVGGCGADRMEMSCGSIPDTQRLLRLPTNSSCVWDTLIGVYKKEGDARTQSFLQVLESDASALRLVTNPCAAVLMVEELKEQSSALWVQLGEDPSPQAIKSALPLFLAEVAKSLRRMNGMSDLETAEQLEQVYREALTLVLFPQLLQQSEVEEVKRRLIGTYGVVMDQAIHGGSLHSSSVKFIGRTEDGYGIHVPAQRYTIAPAHVELLQLGCGPGTGACRKEGVVGAVSRFVEMLLLAGRGRPLQQVLAKLGRSVTEEEKGSEVELAYQGVSVIQNSAGPDWNQQVQACISDNKAVVLVNGSEDPSPSSASSASSSSASSLADLVVFLPEMAVVLVRVISAAASAEQVWGELHKMGHPGNKISLTHQAQGEEEKSELPMLCELSRVPLSSVFWVLVAEATVAEKPKESEALLSQLCSQGAERVLWLQGSKPSLYPAPFPSSSASPKKRSHDDDDD